MNNTMIIQRVTREQRRVEINELIDELRHTQIDIDAYRRRLMHVNTLRDTLNTIRIVQRAFNTK